VRDLQKAMTSLVNIDSSGAVVGPANYSWSISADGKRVSFVIGDFYSPARLFARDLTVGTTTMISDNINREVKTLLSADGRLVTFAGPPNDPFNRTRNFQLFQYDLQQGTTTLVSANRDNSGAASPTSGIDEGPTTWDFEFLDMSSDGRFVAFDSNADNLVAGDYNLNTDVFVRDMQTQSTDLVSAHGPGLPNLFGYASLTSSIASVSADGRYVAFESFRPDLAPAALAQAKEAGAFPAHVYVRDLQSGTDTLVDVNTVGKSSAGTNPVISANGRFVLFRSGSTDLVAAGIVPTGQPPALYLRDLQQGTTQLVSVNDAGVASDDLPEDYSMSADGRFVVFRSSAQDLVAIPRGGSEQTYVRDMQTGVTTLVSVNETSSAGAMFGTFSSPEISGDGRWVVFTSAGPDLAPGVTSQNENVFVRDLQKGTTALVSINRTGTGEGNQRSLLTPHSLSSDGRFVTFTSNATDLVGPDQKAAGQYGNIFVRDLQSGTTSLVSVSADGTSGPFGMAFPTISGNGRFIAFKSTATNLVPGITTSGENIFVRDLQTGTTTLATVNVNGGGTDIGDGFSTSLPLMSDDGHFLVFTAPDKNLVPNDTAGSPYQVFVRDLQKGTTTLVSHNLPGTGGSDSGSGDPIISGDGSTIAFDSNAADLLAHDFAGAENVYTFSTVAPPTAGSTATAYGTLLNSPSAGSVTHHLVVDTTTLSGTAGTLAFQFNPGALPDAQAATVTITNFAGGQFSGSAALQGGASGSLIGTLQLQNTATLNEITQPITFGSNISFDITFTGAALSQPGNGLFGSTFALQLLSADGGSVQLSADPSGAISADELAPDGSVTGKVFSTVGGRPAAALPHVSDAPLTATPASIQAMVGQAFSGTVATFTDAAPSGNIADFTPTITWDDGTTSTGAVVADAQVAGQFDVMGTHTFLAAGSLTIAVAIADVGGAHADVSSPAAVAGLPATENLQLTGVSVSGFEYTPLVDVVIGTLSGGNGQSASAFTATIDWGDGTMSAGTVSAATAGYSVQGTHTYHDEGLYAVTVTIVDQSGSITAETTATMLEELPAHGTRGTANERFISEVYRDLLRRPAEMGGLAFWSGLLDRGLSPSQVVQLIENCGTLEYRAIQVNDLYGRLLHRPADPQGLAVWSAFLQAGGSVAQLAGALAASPEYTSALSAAGFVQALYRDVLGRDADADGTQFWQTLATPDHQARIAEAFFASDEYRQSLVRHFYEDFLDRHAESAGSAYWLVALQRNRNEDLTVAQFLGESTFAEFYDKTK
jgi:Tol biopolymer transport system component